jgi:hypothetical protein
VVVHVITVAGGVSLPQLLPAAGQPEILEPSSDIRLGIVSRRGFIACHSGLRMLVVKRMVAVLIPNHQTGTDN